MYRKKSQIILVIIIGIGLGVFYYSLPLTQVMQKAFAGISVYADENDYQESFIPINISLKEKEQEIMQLDYLCKINNSYIIIGEVNNLQTDSDYYLKGTTNQKEEIDFHLSYADKNLAFFTSHKQLADFSSMELQLYEQKTEGKTILSTEEIDGDIFEDAVYDEVKEIPVDKAFTINLE
ncbi:MAG: hypothetical protein Q4C91_09430 [Eubacteriales bacterium]|nr:hypothetical protein [Eubacteriales bacterium]